MRYFLKEPQTETIGVREISAKTIFVMLYIGAIEGNDIWLRPSQVARMTDIQANKQSKQDRETWIAVSMKPATGAIIGRWYAADTREPIRDETLREGLIPLGAVLERGGLPTNIPKTKGTHYPVLLQVCSIQIYQVCA